MKSARFASLAFLILIFAFSSLIFAAVPQMINYQGKITTPGGALVDIILSSGDTLTGRGAASRRGRGYQDGAWFLSRSSGSPGTARHKRLTGEGLLVRRDWHGSGLSRAV